VGAQFAGLESLIPVLIDKTQTGTTADFFKVSLELEPGSRFSSKEPKSNGNGVLGF
jgi:hypothetical protein